MIHATYCRPAAPPFPDKQSTVEVSVVQLCAPWSHESDHHV